MSYDNAVRRGHPITFSLIVLFGIIELAISAWLVSRFNAHHNYISTAVRNRTRFLLFTSIWTVLFSPVYLGLFVASVSHIVTSIGSHFIFLFLTWVFWLAGAASITESLGGSLNCRYDDFSYCGQQNALEAFAWIEFILTTLALLWVTVHGITAARRGDGYRGQLVSTA